jgi:hypothetical protein
MKNLFFIVGLGAFAAFLLPSTLKAQSNPSYVEPENAAGLNPATPDSPSRDVPQQSTEYAVEALLRKLGTKAGAPDSNDAKSLVAPSVAPAQEDGFSQPTAYSEFKFTHIQDNRTIGFDGPQYNGIAGFDFSSFWDTIVGFSFTYSNQDLNTNFGGTNMTNSNNAYFFSTYAAKNFDDWINLGGSFTYGRTDTTFNAPFPGAALTQKSTQDSYSYAPFIGVAHTWGAFSFSSTTTYIYSYDHFNFDFPITDPGVVSTAIPDAKTLNQSFLWLNNFQYAINDKWSASIQANWTRLLTMQSVPTPITPLIPGLDHQWMSFGARVDYTFNKNGSVFAAFEHDAFDTHFDDYRIRSGVSYNF